VSERIEGYGGKTEDRKRGAHVSNEELSTLALSETRPSEPSSEPSHVTSGHSSEATSTGRRGSTEPSLLLSILEDAEEMFPVSRIEKNGTVERDE
jgi:hypothetical protein